MKKIILLIHITYLTAVGLGGASLQGDAVSLAHNGTGIAGDVNISINPVSILNVSNNKLSFSYNNWFNEVKGSMIKHEFNNQYILLNTYELNDIELWGDKPDSNPIGTFGTHYISLAYGRGFRFDNLKLGAQSNAIHANITNSNNNKLWNNLIEVDKSLFPSAFNKCHIFICLLL